MRKNIFSGETNRKKAVKQEVFSVFFLDKKGG